MKPDGPTYPAIGYLGAIGDGRSLALVGPDGGVEWFCPGRFDHPPLISPLLDRRCGGLLRIAPRLFEETRMRYLEDTAVLEYEWHGHTGHATATVCMEWPGPPDQQCLLWVIRGVSGTTEFTVEFAPSPDFARGSWRSNWSSARVLDMATADQYLTFQTSCVLDESERGSVGRFSVSAGATAVFSLNVSTAANGPAEPLPASSIPERISSTIATWRTWSDRIEWRGSHRQNVLRSAITLKLLIYEPTGAMVAAGTTSLPEEIGGPRNWDYRYTWFRDAGLSLDALFALGCRREAHCWAEWMQTTIERHGTPLRVLYRVDGEIPDAEEIVPAIDGYRGSRPVRTGNAADSQLQLDVYGELLECVFICDTMDDDGLQAHWPHMRAAADFIAAHWHEPDSGIWEVRGAPKHFVHSKAMGWAGLQRALWLQRRHSLDADHRTWAREAEKLREQVFRRGISQDGERFVSAYGEEALDASLLLLFRSGFVDARSDLFRNTVDAIQRELCTDGVKGLLYRYPGDGRDGLTGTEGAFTVCSFWLVEALAAVGRKAEAHALFEQMLALQGDHGLYAEEIDPRSGEQLGNYPQSFPHIGLINAALRLRE